MKRFELAVKGNPKGQPREKESSRGIITTIAKRLRVSRHTVYKFIEDNPKADEIIDDEAEMPFDIAESIVFSRLVQERDLKAAEILLLKHKRGKNRGYGESQDINLNSERGPDLGKIMEEFRNAKESNEVESDESESDDIESTSENSTGQ